MIAQLTLSYLALVGVVLAVAVPVAGGVLLLLILAVAEVKTS